MSSSNNISVIIPAHNNLKELVRCLEVLKSQIQPGNAEVIVVNSQADFQAKGLSQQYPEFKFLHFEEVMLAGRARNLGVKQSTGELLVFLDSDCLWSPNYFNFVQQIALEGPQEIVMTGPIHFENAELQWAKSFHAFEFNEFLAEHSGFSRFVISSNMLISRRLYEKVGGFDESLARCQDLYFSSELKRKFPKLSFLYCSDLRIIHQQHEMTKEALFQKAFLHGQTRNKIDDRLHRAWQFKRKFWYPLFHTQIGWLCFGMLVLRLLRSKIGRRALIKDLLKIQKFCFSWGTGFNRQNKKAG